MQEKNKIFLERTDRLAIVLGITLRELGPRIGISPAMLFGCRKGQYNPSRKTLLKLEQAESDAGVTPVSPEVRPDWMERPMGELNTAERAQDLMMVAKDFRRQAIMYRKMADDEDRQADECERSAKELLAREKKR